MKYRTQGMKGLRLLMILILMTVGFNLPTALTQSGQKILIPMDISQSDHLKAYGISYMALSEGIRVDWLLNYRGGSFLLDFNNRMIGECRLRGVSFQLIDGAAASVIYNEVQSEDNNTEVIRLEKEPRIAVYTPPGSQPWDDAVTLAMEYAEIPYQQIWDKEVLEDSLRHYDWLHLHHEDFTGQYGKFYASFANASWYIAQVETLERTAKSLGYRKVSELKKAVVERIRQYIAGGGFMFAMCSATDTYDIAQAAASIDICAEMFDGDPADPTANDKLDFDRTFAFENFKLIMDPYQYEYSTIDVNPTNLLATQDTDYFTLFDFSAKYDPVPTMLTQCHVNVVRGFLGQTTAFHKRFIKKSVTILGERDGSDQVKYIHGKHGRGTFTWYAGHDPEDYRHAVGDPPTDLKLHKNSPGYRLILNNILFPAAEEKPQKT